MAVSSGFECGRGTVTAFSSLLNLLLVCSQIGDLRWRKTSRRDSPAHDHHGCSVVPSVFLYGREWHASRCFNYRCHVLLRHGVACDCVFVAESPAESPGVTELATGVVPSPSPDDHPLDTTWLASVLNPSTAKHNGKWLAVFAGLGNVWRRWETYATLAEKSRCACLMNVCVYGMHVCMSCMYVCTTHINGELLYSYVYMEK